MGGGDARFSSLLPMLEKVNPQTGKIHQFIKTTRVFCWIFDDDNDIDNDNDNDNDDDR